MEKRLENVDAWEAVLAFFIGSFSFSTPTDASLALPLDPRFDLDDLTELDFLTPVSDLFERDLEAFDVRFFQALLPDRETPSDSFPTITVGILTSGFFTGFTIFFATSSTSPTVLSSKPKIGSGIASSIRGVSLPLSPATARAPPRP